MKRSEEEEEGNCVCEEEEIRNEETEQREREPCIFKKKLTQGYYRLFTSSAGSTYKNAGCTQQHSTKYLIQKNPQKKKRHTKTVPGTVVK